MLGLDELKTLHFTDIPDASIRDCMVCGFWSFFDGLLQLLAAPFGKSPNIRRDELNRSTSISLQAATDMARKRLERHEYEREQRDGEDSQA